MVLLDSDVVLYLRDPKWGEVLAKRLDSIRMATCNVVVAEVLGLKGMDKSDAFYFAELFATMNNLPFDEEVTQHVIELKRLHGMQLPSAIVAATALANGVALWTHDHQSFRDIRHLELLDPLVE